MGGSQGVVEIRFIQRKWNVLHSTRLLFSILLLLLTSPLYATGFSGPVISVLDGDTKEVLHHQRAENASASAASTALRKAKYAVADLAFGKEVTIQTPTDTNTSTANSHLVYLQALVANVLLQKGSQPHHVCFLRL